MIDRSGDGPTGGREHRTVRARPESSKGRKFVSLAQRPTKIFPTLESRFTTNTGANPVATNFEMPEWKVRGSWPGSFYEASTELHGGLMLNKMQFSRESYRLGVEACSSTIDKLWIGDFRNKVVSKCPSCHSLVFILNDRIHLATFSNAFNGAVPPRCLPMLTLRCNESRGHGVFGFKPHVRQKFHARGSLVFVPGGQ
jgi:hypothetical protein